MATKYSTQLPSVVHVSSATVFYCTTDVLRGQPQHRRATHGAWLSDYYWCWLMIFACLSQMCMLLCIYNAECATNWWRIWDVALSHTCMWYVSGIGARDLTVSRVLTLASHKECHQCCICFLSHDDYMHAWYCICMILIVRQIHKGSAMLHYRGHACAVPLE